MRENKRKRLKARGWKVGSAKDFLGLNDRHVCSPALPHHLDSLASFLPT